MDEYEYGYVVGGQCFCPGSLSVEQTCAPRGDERKGLITNELVLGLRKTFPSLLARFLWFWNYLRVSVLG